MGRGESIIADAGETLYLPPELEAYSIEEQRLDMEQDEREGLVQEYLDMLLPDEWDSRDTYKRRDYFQDKGDPLMPPGITKGTRSVCLKSGVNVWVRPSLILRGRAALM